MDRRLQSKGLAYREIEVCEREELLLKKSDCSCLSKSKFQRLPAEWGQRPCK
jgi:hypothetical protein